MPEPTTHPGTEVVVTDLATGANDRVTLRDAYVVICDGTYYIDGCTRYANGTHVLTLKTGAVITPREAGA